MQFTPNQRVIYIDDIYPQNTHPAFMSLIKGKIYRVRGYNAEGGVLLFGISIFAPDGRECGWKDTRFKPVDNWADNILEIISHEIS